jgi:hypothetical protein
MKSLFLTEIGDPAVNTTGKLELKEMAFSDSLSGKYPRVVLKCN